MTFPRKKILEFIKFNRLVLSEEIVNYLESEDIKIGTSRTDSICNIRSKLNKECKYDILNMIKIRCSDNFIRNAYYLYEDIITEDMIKRIQNIEFTRSPERLSKRNLLLHISGNESAKIMDIIRCNPNITGREVTRLLGWKVTRKTTCNMRGRLARLVKRGSLEMHKDGMYNVYKIRGD